MLIKNSDDRYGLVAILLHWVIAFLIIGLLALGLYMVRLPIGLEKLKLFGWHKEYGLLVLGLAIVRITWRLMNQVPRLNIPWYERVAAHTVHWAFYGFMFAMPITGWAVTSAAGVQPSFFGLFTLPALVAPNKELMHTFAEIHEWLAYGLIAAIVLHILGALKHSFFDDDDILRRMIP